MATYLELYDLKNNDTVHHKIAVALTKKAKALMDLTPPSADQIAWANNALSDLPKMIAKILPYVLAAANTNATTQQIIDATDAAVQSNVDTAVDKLIAGGIVS